MFTAPNLLNLSNVPLSVSSPGLKQNTDYKTTIINSSIKDGLFLSEVGFKLLSPQNVAKSKFTIEPSLPDPPAQKIYLFSNKNTASLSPAGLEVDFSSISNCDTSKSIGKGLAIGFLILFILTILFFIVSNLIFIDSFLKFFLLRVVVGSQVLAFVVLARDVLGEISKNFADGLYLYLI